MKKFITVVKAYWQRALAYRFTLVAYRLGELSEVLILILMWKAIYRHNPQAVQGFTEREMITYLLIGNVFNYAVRNFLASLIAFDIKEGRLSMYLIRPMSYFYYILSREIGRIALATGMSVLSQFLVILFFSKTFIWNTRPWHLLLIFCMLVLAFFTEILLASLIGLIAFWTDEVDGLYSTIDRLKKFFAGGYFPINLLSVSFVHVSFLLPFVYSFFVPAQLYLQKIPLAVGLQGIGIQLIWIALLMGIIRRVWKRGLAKYEGVGI